MIPRIIYRNLSITKSHNTNHKLTGRYLHSSKISDDDIEISYGQSNEHKLKTLLDSSTSFVETKPRYDEDKWATLPYAEGTILSKRERIDLDIQRPKVDPRDTSLILFPGQGAQFVGMAKSVERVPAAKDLFDYASEILKYLFLP